MAVKKKVLSALGEQLRRLIAAHVPGVDAVRFRAASCYPTDNEIDFEFVVHTREPNSFPPFGEIDGVFRRSYPFNVMRAEMDSTYCMTPEGLRVYVKTFLLPANIGDFAAPAGDWGELFGTFTPEALGS